MTDPIRYLADVEAYRQFRFEAWELEQIVNGIRFTPMRLNLTTE
jgi:hypothetical protein